MSKTENGWEVQLAFRDVSFQYGKDASSVIFHQLNSHVRKGEIVSLLGPSGSGKSTFFRLVTGLENPTEGEIFINEQPAPNRLGKIGYMPQKDLLMPWRTVLENGLLPLELKGVPKKEAVPQVKKHLETFGLSGTENQYPDQLSGGMRQRVSFLRTMLSGSDIILLDEPFSALDSITRYMMQEWLLQQWISWKKTFIFITHDIEEALFLSDRILLFSAPPIKSRLEETDVPLARPRGDETRSDPVFISLKKELLSKMKMRAE